ncbi:hypothetical protein Sjap_015203 [Stephania japonica]|uniref:Uncharacterized protein n=1 Tax=Stephania japonica TaxID=461633 RepID=A0AAP0IIN7_9MAGN
MSSREGERYETRSSEQRRGGRRRGERAMRARSSREGEAWRGDKRERGREGDARALITEEEGEAIELEPSLIVEEESEAIELEPSLIVEEEGANMLEPLLVVEEGEGTHSTINVGYGFDIRSKISRNKGPDEGVQVDGSSACGEAPLGQPNPVTNNTTNASASQPLPTTFACVETPLTQCFPTPSCNAKYDGFLATSFEDFSKVKSEDSNCSRSWR